MTQQVKVYFAHCIADYDTERERGALDLIRAYFGHDAIIVNPNDEYLSKAYAAWRDSHPSRALDPMKFWRQEVGMCDAVAYLVNEDGYSIGAGVAAEVLEAVVHGKPVVRLYEGAEGISASLQGAYIHDDVLTIEQTRAYIKTVEENRLASQPETPA